ncbi:hypothetical protein D3C81_1304960 [compost metagenome]
MHETHRSCHGGAVRFKLLFSHCLILTVVIGQVRQCHGSSRLEPWRRAIFIRRTHLEESQDVVVFSPVNMMAGRATHETVGLSFRISGARRAHGVRSGFIQAGRSYQPAICAEP